MRTRLAAKLPARDLHQLTEGGTVAVSPDGGGWVIEVPGHGGAILEWRGKP